MLIDTLKIDHPPESHSKNKDGIKIIPPTPSPTNICLGATLRDGAHERCNVYNERCTVQ